MIRVYVGAGLADMRTLTGTGALPERLEGYAATSGLRSELDLADEDLEFALTLAAAEASAAAATDTGLAVGRRFVVVADVAAADLVTLDDSAGTVRIQPALALSSVAAVLADAADVVFASAGDHLAWFAQQEIADLLT
jgi:hypothetical protein